MARNLIAIGWQTWLKFACNWLWLASFAWLLSHADPSGPEHHNKDLNPDGVLMRYEFLGSILRTAVQKYIVFEKRTKDHSDAVEMLSFEVSTPQLVPKA